VALTDKRSFPKQFILKAANSWNLSDYIWKNPWEVQHLHSKTSGQDSASPNASDNYVQVQFTELLHLGMMD